MSNSAKQLGLQGTPILPRCGSGAALRSIAGFGSAVSCCPSALLGTARAPPCSVVNLRLSSVVPFLPTTLSEALLRPSFVREEDERLKQLHRCGAGDFARRNRAAARKTTMVSWVRYSIAAHRRLGLDGGAMACLGDWQLELGRKLVEEELRRWQVGPTCQIAHVNASVHLSVPA